MLARDQAAPQAVQPAAPAAAYALDQKLPVDSRITVGQLPNGLRYWIRVNKEPKNRAELRIVVNAGSVLEDEDQRGLAHVVEHLAFNGSTHFPQQKLVDFMQSIGMRFGPDLNAFTGLDETIYLLKVPTDSPEILATSFLILEDWAQRRHVRPQGGRQGARHHRRGVAARPGRRRANAPEAVPRPAPRLALRRPRSHRQEGDHRELFGRDPQALLPDLVPPRSDGRHRRGRLRQGPDRGARQEALRPAHRPARGPAASGLPRPRPRGHPLRHRRRQGGRAEHRRRLPQAPARPPGHGGRLPADARRAALQRHAQQPHRRDPPEARPAFPRGHFEPRPVRRLEGRLRPVGPGRRRRRRPRPPRPLRRGREGGPLRLHLDRAGAPEERDAALFRAGHGPAGVRGHRRPGRGVHPELPRGRADARHPGRVRPPQAVHAGDHGRGDQRPGPGVDDRQQPRHHRERPGEGGGRRPDRNGAPRRPRGGEDRRAGRLRGHDDRRPAPCGGTRARRDRRRARRSRPSA